MAHDPFLDALFRCGRAGKIAPVDMMIVVFIKDRPRLRFDVKNVALYLGLSETSVRRSVRRLQQMGVLHKKENAFFYSVNPIKSWVSVLR